MWNLKNYTNEFVYKTETDSQTQKKNLELLKGKGRRDRYIVSLGLTYKYYDI